MTLRDDWILEPDLSFLLYGSLISFFLTIILFRFASPLVSRLLCPSYKLLPEFHQREWDDRFISNINAAISICISVYTLLYEDEMTANHVWHDSFLARLGCAIVVGYMAGDLVVMAVWCKPGKGEMIGFLFHHAATMYAYSLISVYGVLCYFGMLRLIAELSTPAVNQRWFFDILEIPRSNSVVLVNGLLMVVTFFLFRMITLPIYWFQIWQVSNTDATARLGHIQLIMYIPTFILDVLNVWWFYKMVKGFVKAVMRLKAVSENDEKMKRV